MSQDTHDIAYKETQADKKGKRPFALSDIIVVAVILLLVILLLFMGKRTCSVTLDADINDGAEWVEVWNDDKVAMLTDEGYTSETAYTFQYRTAGSRASVTVVYAYVDKKTGEEMAERVAYEFTTDAFGFITVRLVEVPLETD